MTFVDPLEQLELGRMRTDPVAFVEYGLGVRLDPWQSAMWRSTPGPQPDLLKLFCDMWRKLEEDARR